MAPKRPSLLDEPPAASTSEEEEEAASEEEEEYENGPETEPEPKRKRPKISPNHASDKEADRTTSALSEMVAFIKSSDMVRLSERVLKQALDSLAEPKRAELEEKWKKLNLAELEIYAKRVQLISDRAKLILDAYNKSSGYKKC